MSEHRSIGIALLALLPAVLAPEELPSQSRLAPRARVVAAAQPVARGDASASLLERPALLEVANEPLGEALLRLQRSSGVSIAFSPTRIPSDARVSCDCRHVTVAAALSRLLDGLPFAGREMRGIVTIEPVAAAADAAPARTADAELLATLTGHVTEVGSGRPLAGVQVYLEGATRLGGISGEDGEYRIAQVPAGTHTVAARFIGFAAERKTVTVPEEGMVTADFALTKQVIALDAVLVTGTAGRQERRAQGATIADVNVSSIQEVAPVASVSEVLQGRIPGVSITGGSGVAGSGQQIRIRGASSISLSNEPLVFVDGIRVDTKQTTAASGAVVNPLNDLNPDEIESIEVVKGPAAATLYGADASAGVIQIITKRGIAATPFRTTLSLGASRLEAAFTPYANFGVCRAQDIGVAPICEGKSAGDIVSDRPMERYGLPDAGDQRSISVTTRGGGEKYGFFSSLGLDRETGLFPNSTYQRLSGRLNYNMTPKEEVRVEFNLPVLRIAGAFPVTAGSSRGWTTGGMAGSPLTYGTTTDGWFASNRTPEAMASIEHTLGSTRLIPDVKVNWQTLGRLRNRVTLGADISTTDLTEFFPKNDRGWYSATENRGLIREDRRNLQRLTANYLGTVELPLTEAWASTLSFGSEIQVEKEDLTYASGNGLTTNAARSVSAAAQISGGQTVIQDRRVGFYGQWEPNYRERVYLQFGLRADRFAAFGAAAPWFMSPSARLSYVISDESFWNVAWLPSLRLRTAYGTTGRAPTAGASLQTYSASPYLRGPGQVASGIVPLNPGNSELEAERGEEFEAGLDATLFGSRLGVELTYYDKTTRNLLLRVPRPPSVGFQEDAFQNVGEVKNSGVELALRGQVLQGERVGWEVNAAVNTLHNEVVDLGGVQPFATVRFGRINQVMEGYQVGAFFTNRIRSVDLENGVAIVSDSLEYIGNLLPTLEGNVSSTLTLFRDFRVYAHLDYKRDVSLYNATALYRDRNFGVGEAWVRRNEILTEEQRLRRFGPYVTESGDPIGAGSVLEEYIEPADFVRLNEVSLSYKLPEVVAARGFRARSASITLSARNLAVWSEYSGFNPDVQNEFDAIAGRADFFTLPPSRRYGLRVDLTF